MLNGYTFQRLFKYFLEGLAVAVAAFYIPARGAVNMQEVMMVGLTAATVFLVLDLFAPAVGLGARGGAGFGIGGKMVGFRM